jgi:polyhydroxyalkanoate synthesis regulator phasin
MVELARNMERPRATAPGSSPAESASIGAEIIQGLLQGINQAQIKDAFDTALINTIGEFSKNPRGHTTDTLGKAFLNNLRKELDEVLSANGHRQAFEVNGLSSSIHPNTPEYLVKAFLTIAKTGFDIATGSNLGRTFAKGTFDMFLVTGLALEERHGQLKNLVSNSDFRQMRNDAINILERVLGEDIETFRKNPDLYLKNLRDTREKIKGDLINTGMPALDQAKRRLHSAARDLHELRDQTSSEEEARMQEIREKLKLPKEVFARVRNLLGHVTRLNEMEGAAVLLQSLKYK